MACGINFDCDGLWLMAMTKPRSLSSRYLLEDALNRDLFTAFERRFLNELSTELCDLIFSHFS